MSFGKIGVTLLLVVIAATVASVFVTPLFLHAQTPEAVPTFSATVVNRSKGEIYFKIVGGQGKSFVEGTLQPNFKTTQQATRGDKVVCVWNKEGYLLAAWRLMVVGNCTITVPELDSSKHPNYSEPGKGVVNMERDSSSDIKSMGPPPTIERKPN